MSIVRLGLVGYGYWGRRMLPAITADGRFEVRSILVRNPRLIEPDRSLPPVTDDRDGFFRDRSVDAVVVASPASTHYSMGKLALDAAKDLLIEKPFGETARQARELSELARERGLRIVVDYTFSLLPVVDVVKQIIESGEAGSLVKVNLAMTQLGRFNGIDVYRLLGSHMLAVLNRLLPVSDLRFERLDILTNHGIAETGAVFFAPRPGKRAALSESLSGCIHLSLNDAVKRRQMTLCGTRGEIQCDMGDSGGVVLIRHSADGPDAQSVYESGYRSMQPAGLVSTLSFFHDVLHGRAPGNCWPAVAVSEALERISSAGGNARPGRNE